ncbi:MAG: FHA domain-containing protein [Planctomycetota bacterium]
MKLAIRVNGQVHVFETDQPAVTFGRSPDCAIQVGDQAASRLHCRLESTPEGWKLVDLESSNGTSVNGQLTNSRLLRDGDVISIGAFSAVLNPAAVTPVADPVRPLPAGPVAQVARVDHAQRVVSSGARREKDGARGLVVSGLLAASLLFGGVWAVNHFYGGNNTAEQRATLEKASQLASRGELDSAEKALIELLSHPVGSDIHKDAKKALADIQGRIATRDAKAKQAAEAAEYAAASTKRASDLQAEFDKATADADALVVQEAYGPALDIWKRFNADNPGSALSAKADARLAEVMKSVQDAWDVLENRANSLVKMEETSAAAALVGSSIEKFQGTRFQFSAQDKLAALNRLAGLGTDVAGTGSKLSSRTQDSLLTVLDLVKARRYAQALREIDGVLSGAAAAEKASLEAQRAEIASQAALFGKLVDAVNGGWFKSRPLQLANDMSAYLVTATEDTLSIDFRDEAGKGGTTSKRWHQVEAEDMVGYFRSLDLSSADQLSLAAFCYSNAMNFTAAEVLYALIRKDASRQAAAFELVARQRGIAVPQNGFQWYEGGFYTQEELKFAKLEVDAKKGAQLVAQSDPKKAAEGYALYQRVMADPSGSADQKARVKAQYMSAVKTRKAALLKKLQDPTGVASAIAMREVKKELNERREEALRLIFDKGTYSDEDKGRSGQSKVNSAVAAVKELWDNPMPWASKSVKSIADLVSGVEQSNEWLRSMGAPASETDPSAVSSALSAAGAAMNLREFCMTATERMLLDRHKAVTAYNDGLSGFELPEKACIRAINDYRFMMGRADLEAQVQLGTAARQHASNMHEAKYFSHEGPLASRKSPADRARYAGYPGGVIGENIAQGVESAGSVFEAWYNWSTYHRNMLSDLYTQVGAGKSWTLWTVDFGRGGSAMGATVAGKGKGGSKGGNRDGGGASGTSGTSGGSSSRGGTSGSSGGMTGGTRGGVAGGVAGGSTGGGGC